MRKIAAIATVCVILIGIWCAWAYYVSLRFPSDPAHPETEISASALRGQFGDMFGGINALFTALLLAGAFYTIWLQHQEIDSLRRQQVESQRDSARTALILAHAAQVSAKSAILQMRYQMVRDTGTALDKVPADSENSGILYLFMQSNSVEAGKAINDLEALSKRLSEIMALADPQPSSDGEPPSKDEAKS